MLSSSDAVVPSMNVLAILLLAMRDRIFFWARKPMSRALNALSVMTKHPKKMSNKKILIQLSEMARTHLNRKNPHQLICETYLILAHAIASVQLRKSKQIFVSISLSLLGFVFGEENFNGTLLDDRYFWDCFKCVVCNKLTIECQTNDEAVSLSNHLFGRKRLFLSKRGIFQRTKMTTTGTLHWTCVCTGEPKAVNRWWRE